MSPPPDAEPAAIARVFNDHGVKYVVIGAFAAIAQQAPIPPTRDIDFTPEVSAANLQRLSTALHELGARIRSDAAEEGLPFDHDASSLGKSGMWNLVSPYGEFDVCFSPAGFSSGYRDLIQRAHRVLVGDVEVMVADLDDVIRSKEEAGRPKDVQTLPALYRHRARRSGGRPSE